MRVTAPTMLAAAIVVGAALPAVGLGAAIGLQDDRMAVTSAGNIPGRIAMARATGTKALRIDLFWATAAPTEPAAPTNHLDPAYAWSWADATLCGAVKAGMQPIVTVWNAPGWATNGKRGVKSAGGLRVPWNSKAPTNPRDFADFMSALATRYNGVTQIPGQGTCLVKFYEIWNEPNLQIYLYPQYSGKKVVSAPKYVKMANLAVPAIKAANPRAVPITGVTGPKGKSDRSGRGTIDWVRDLKTFGLKAGSEYSQHIYPSVPPLKQTKIFPAWATLTDIVAEVNRLPGGRSKKIYITEASYTTAKTPYRNVAFTTAQQAAYMKDIFKVPFAKSPRVPIVIWFQLQDNPNWPGGLLLNSGAQKLSYAQFQKLTESNPPKGNLRPGS
ncbi:MAG: hypothetical protein FJW92_03310 [Actinobacteria bacterium]|nr:hypothetical protein [Actinomycetota bacterium]